MGETASSAAPRVTVVVTCFRQGPYVTAALDSVASQTFDDWELIITDDASDDDSAAVIRDWADRSDRPVSLVLHQENVGLTRTLNEALPQCRGEYLAYLGGDDVWAPEKLKRSVAALDVEAGAAVAYSDARLIDADGEVLEISFLESEDHLPPPDGDAFDRFLHRNPVIASSAVFRREAIQAVGGWDPDLPFEDWDLLLRLADRWPVVHTPGALVDYRVHDASLIRSRFSLMLEGRLTVLEKWVGRDPTQDEVILPYLRDQSWRLYKVHPHLGRDHVAVAYRGDRSPRGRARHLVATSSAAESVFELLRRVRRRFR